MKCKYCQAELDENSEICPVCGKSNSAEDSAPDAEIVIDAAEETIPEESVSEETISEETAAEASAEQDSSEDAAEEAAAPAAHSPENKPKMTAGKLALIIGLAVVAVALVVALILAGFRDSQNPSTLPETTSAPQTDASSASVPDLNVTEGTIPADGNPDDITCKGTYTVNDETLMAQKDDVVATVDGNELTVGMLQFYYWLGLYDFLDQHVDALPYLGLDYTQPLDKQSCHMMEDTLGVITWQQYFLHNAIKTWHRYQSMSMEAQKANLSPDAEFMAFLNGIEDSMQASAVQYGFESAVDMLHSDVGPAGTIDDYKQYRKLAYEGYLYFDHEYAKLDPTMEEIEKYFADHAADLEKEGITKEAGKLVDVRHILIAPEGGTKDDKGNTTYSDEEWAACEAKAQSILDEWLAGEHTQESFAKLAKEKSEDPGSQANGGLYSGVRKGQMVEPFDAWCFDESRKEGDSGLVKTSFGYHIMYFVDSQDIWYVAARTSLLAELSDNLVNDVSESHPLTVDYSKIAVADITPYPAS